MLKIHLKAAWRNLWKARFYNGLSLLGLSLGLTVAIFIAVWINSELNYNNIGDAENIFRVSSNFGTGENKQTWGSSVGPVAYYAKKEVPEVKNAARVSGNNWYRIFSGGGKNLEATGAALVDPEFFSLFDIHFLKGDKNKPFSGNSSVIITKAAAHKFFGSMDAIGKTITADYKETFTVVGIVENIPDNSSIQYEIFFPISIVAAEYNGEGFWESMDSDWGNFNFVTYLKLNQNASAAKVVEKLTKIQKAKDRNAHQEVTDPSYYLQPIKNMNLYSYGGNPRGIKTVRIFGVVLILILCIACINYVNLNTARAIQRAKEVSLRKLIGAEKKHLFFQFVTESFIFFLIATVLALGLIFLLAPSFNSIAAKNIDFSLFDAYLWKLILVVFAITLVASSIYPALLLSSFKPLEAIKGMAAPGVGAGNFRKILVCIQFVFSVILIISTIIIGKQLSYIKSKNPGYDRSQVLTFSMTSEMTEHRAAVKNEIGKIPAIEGISFSNNNLVKNGWTTGDTDWENKDPQSDIIVSPLGADENFIPLMKMELVQGRNFTGRALDSTRYILNEAAVRKTGIQDPIGKNFKLWETEGTIIGVVKDFNFTSMKNTIAPAVIYYDPEPYKIYVKTAAGKAGESIAALENIWKNYNEGYPFTYSFLDEDYESLYRADLRTGTLFNIFSILAIFVSCLGLFGLTTYTAELKKREIGIRKVLGASIAQITNLLSKDFLKLIFISSIIAIPVGWYLMQFWLQNFAYKTSLDWWIFAGAGLLTLGIALITVSFQSIKAALQNPVKSIRTE
ncbi:ABC transporter permease [Autumnicola musiva]|uniref:ABC transporter permease n=1 Tax=Autumnicola musiva TaxID=3075589 RepID=A0ABU3DAQ4_9FLAO|nr:ABC transporter permease [Zunongwangia sp. F117]MDT0678608.1 ABC transporter permease [Zunongwangia sp. F117]